MHERQLSVLLTRAQCALLVDRKPAIDVARRLYTALGNVLGAQQGALPPAVKKKRVRAASTPDIDRVFAHWQAATGHATMTLTEQRARAIRARLATFSVADLCRAIDGCMAREHNATTPHHDIELICRNDTKVEQYMSTAPGADAPATTNGSSGRTAREILEDG